ncbi:MAG: hypothetical protein CME17_07650 [Gemmatimonadetes bacterium]|nr:hypothetical protein [Gemmatimonadota bacterium]
MNRLGKLLALSAIGFISLGTTLEAQNVDPVGVYGITINIPEMGFQLPGTMTIEDSDNGLTGSMELELPPEMPSQGPADLFDITVEGNVMKCRIGVEGATVDITLNFEDDGFEGSLMSDMGAFDITGTKR